MKRLQGDTNFCFGSNQSCGDGQPGIVMESFSHPDYQRGSVQAVIPVTAPVVIAVTVSLMKDCPSYSSCEWHSEGHSRTRETMKQCILHLIHQRKGNPSPEWLQVLPDVCTRVEEHLYHTAANFDEYNNPRTLLDRLLDLVQSLASGHGGAKVGTVRHPVDERDPTATKKTEQPKKMRPKSSGTAHARQVSSQGCSRVFIAKVLHRVADFVHGKKLPSIFTFPKELVMSWLDEAKDDCCDCDLEQEEARYGGPPFLLSDPSTHWSEPHQLYTWWKNNVERKTKFKIIQDDSFYHGTDERRTARAHWCKTVVALSEKIRKSSGSGAHGRSFSRGTGGASGEGDRHDGSMRNRPAAMGDPLGNLLAAAEQLEECYREECQSEEGSDSLSVAEDSGKSRETAGRGAKQSARSTYQPTFPLKLFDLVTAQTEVIGWVNGGTSFQIFELDVFVESLLPQHFKHKNFTSFQRQLNLYGFRRTKEADRGAYSHPHFVAGRRELAARMRRPLNGQIPSTGEEPETSLGDDLNEGDESEDSSRDRRKRGGTDTASGDDDDSASNPSHAYGTRRKRMRKRFDEFVTEDESESMRSSVDFLPSAARQRDGPMGEKGAGNYEIGKDARMLRTQRSNHDASGGRGSRVRAMSTLSMASSSHEGAIFDSSYDEIIDMRAAARRPRRAMTKTVRIDMRPTLSGHEAVVSQSVVVNVPRVGDSKAVASLCVISADSATDDAGLVANYAAMQRTTSHSKCTRVGDDFQADLPELITAPQPPQCLPADPPLGRDETYESLRQMYRSVELEYLKQSGRVVAALLPPPNCRNGRKQSGMPDVVFADPSLREISLRTCHGGIDPVLAHTYMTRHAAKSLCPRLCITLRTFTLVTAVKDEVEGVLDVPSLLLLADTGAVYSCDLWGCNFCASPDSSSDDEDIFTGEPRVCSVLSDRYRGVTCSLCGGDVRKCPHMTFVQVSDGVQDWIVPLSCCASNGCVDREQQWIDEYIMSTAAACPKVEASADLEFVRANGDTAKTAVEACNRFARWSPEEIAALRSAMRKCGRNLFRVWRELVGLADEESSSSLKHLMRQSDGPSSPSWVHPIPFGEFVDFVHQLCSVPSASRRSGDSRSDGRLQAARRLQSMLLRFTSLNMSVDSPVGDSTSMGSESEESSRLEG